MVNVITSIEKPLKSNNGSSAKQRRKDAVITVYPPWHSIVLIIVVLSFCGKNMASSIDITTTRASITTPLFENYISQQTLGWIRIFFSIFCVITTITTLLAQPIEVTINYSKNSKLKSFPMVFRGTHRQLFFTRITWNLLAISCGLNGLLTLWEYHESHQQWLSKNQWIYRVALYLFEVVSPSTMLVSCCVRYSLWPNALAKGAKTDGFKTITALLQHNANLLISLVEAALLGRIPVRLTDVPVGIGFQCCYVSMVWSMMYRWHPSGEPQVLYHFLDPTLGMTTTISLLVLMFVSVLFNMLFVFLETILEHLNENFLAHVLLIILVFSSLSKFRD
jgi:hypothetical protein